MNYCAKDPSFLWEKEIGSRLDMYGNPYFKYLGNCRIISGKFNLPTQTLVHPLLVDIAKEVVPEFLNDDMSLKVKYSMTAKYPLAEYKSLAAFGVDDVNINLSLWDLATEMLHDCLIGVQGSSILSTDTAFSWVDRKTSAGYPWSLKYYSKGDLVDSEMFYSYYHRFQAAINQGCYYPVIARGSIKTELKKKEDIALHMPRTFMAMPTEMNILGNKLFGDMNSKMAFLGSTQQAPIYIGVTRFHGNWHDLAINLNRFPNKNDGDMTKFDRNLRLFVMNTIRDFRKKNMNTNKWDNAIDFYYATMVFTILIGILGDLFMKFNGNPSGQTNTLADNSLAHILYWFFHWVAVVCPKLKLQPTWNAFKEHVCLVVMGDDVIYSYSDFVAPFMNPIVVAKSMATLGNSFKYSHSMPMQLDDLEFCSTNFLKVDGMYMPVLKFEKMLASIFYKVNTNCAKPHRLILRRLMSLRIECWYNLKIRRIINAVIFDFKNLYQTELKQTPTGFDGDDCTYVQIMSLNWSSHRIERHYRISYE